MAASAWRSVGNYAIGDGDDSSGRNSDGAERTQERRRSRRARRRCLRRICRFAPLKLIPDNDGELLSLPLFLCAEGEDGAEEEKGGREEGREVEVDCPLSRTAHKWSARFQDQTRAAEEEGGKEEGGREGRGSKEERTGFLPHLSDIYLDRMGRTPTTRR